ncbi:hypothetical protein [Persicobacter diffluens]|uniref:Uncharacterized protein n=1 Tax=Persicobacter diffluens TaxID=981 RepID=A0AAN5AKE8_9BACT|nr:hypothetical protein PEDI_33370 [Persicobacter diffluens]
MEVINIQFALALHEKRIFTLGQCEHALLESWEEEFHPNGVVKGYKNSWKVSTVWENTSEPAIPAPTLTELSQRLRNGNFMVELSLLDKEPSLKIGDQLTYHGKDMVSAKMVELLLRAPEYYRNVGLGITNQKDYPNSKKMEQLDNIRMYQA